MKHKIIKQGKRNVKERKVPIWIIEKGANLARKLQKDFPEIADAYREGRTHLQIVEDFDIVSKYDESLSVAKHAVYCAIRGYSGNFGNFEGLITDQNELERLCYEHHARCGRDMLKRKQGAFSLTLEERKKLASKVGRKNHELGIGIHAQTTKELKRNSAKGAIARGCVPWKSDELELVYRLSQFPEYQYHGNRSGRASTPNLPLLADRLNSLYHEDQPIRDRNAIKWALSRYRKLLTQQ